VVVSIIGIERFTGGYGAAKVAHERAWRSGPIPVRIVRAAQFHEFVGQLLEWGSRGEVSVVPEMRTQIVAARAVAEVIADVIEADAAGAAGTGTIEVAGPREETLAALATELAARQGSVATVRAVRDPGDPDGEMQATGGLLPGPGARLVGPTFREWLAAQ
jgi:uncharacterized protein YbjT (DUF2867 family)